MNTRTEIEHKIVDYIRDNPGTSFREIERIFEENGFDYKGEHCFYLPGFPNIIIWGHWNKKAINLFNSLRGILIPEPAQPLLYVVDGVIPDLPIATDALQYETPHWLPVIFSVAQ